MASDYSERLAENLKIRIAYFSNAGLCEEAKLLQARLNAIGKKHDEKSTAVSGEIQAENPIAKTIVENLRAKLNEETRRIPDLEKQYILENLSKAKTLKELKPLRIAYIERLVKINRANNSEKITFVSENNTETGPYNNEKIFYEALQLIYSQEPLWLEDLKELYLSIMPS